MIDLRGVQEGMPVRSADGRALGRVLFCRHEDFLVEAGAFFPRDYRARYGQVIAIDRGTVVLAGSAAQLLQHVAAPRPDDAEEEAAAPPPGERRAGRGRERRVPDELRATGYGDAGLDDGDLERS